MSNLNFKEAASELSQAADYLRATGNAKVGCTGARLWLHIKEIIKYYLYAADWIEV